jgi:hypothetical protein
MRQQEEIKKKSIVENKMNQVIGDIAKSTGLPEASVKLVLDQLGFDKTMAKIQQSIGGSALQNLKVGDLTVSAKVAGMLVAR